MFQVPEEIGQKPPMPAPEDSWAMRFYSEAEIREKMLPLGFQLRDGERRRIETPETTFHHLRIVATKPRARVKAG